MKLKVAAKVAPFYKGQVLLIADHDGKWDLPGGGIEGDERLEQALCRELREETGLAQFSIDKVIHVDEWFIEEKDLHVVCIYYRGELEGEPKLALSNEHSDVAWVAPQELPTFTLWPDTLRAIEKAGPGA